MSAHLKPDNECSERMSHQVNQDNSFDIQELRKENEYNFFFTLNTLWTGNIHILATQVTRKEAYVLWLQKARNLAGSVFMQVRGRNFLPRESVYIIQCWHGFGVWVSAIIWKQKLSWEFLLKMSSGSSYVWGSVGIYNAFSGQNTLNLALEIWLRLRTPSIGE